MARTSSKVAPAKKAAPKRGQIEPGHLPEGQAAGTITSSTAAKLIRVGEERVRQLVKQGWIKKLGKDSFRVLDVIHGYLDFRDDADRRASKSAVQSRAQEARAKEIELRIAREEKTIIDTAEAIAAVDDVVGGIRADLAGLAARVTRDIALRQKIEREIDGILTAAADRFEQRASDLRTRGEVAAPDAEDDA